MIGIGASGCRIGHDLASGQQSSPAAASRLALDGHHRYHGGKWSL